MSTSMPLVRPGQPDSVTIPSILGSAPAPFNSRGVPAVYPLSTTMLPGMIFKIVHPNDPSGLPEGLFMVNEDGKEVTEYTYHTLLIFPDMKTFAPCYGIQDTEGFFNKLEEWHSHLKYISFFKGEEAPPIWSVITDISSGTTWRVVSKQSPLSVPPSPPFTTVRLFQEEFFSTYADKLHGIS